MSVITIPLLALFVTVLTCITTKTDGQADFDFATLNAHVLKLEATISDLQTKSQTQENKFTAVLSSVLSKLENTTAELSALKSQAKAQEQKHADEMTDLLSKLTNTTDELKDVKMEFSTLTNEYRSLQKELATVRNRTENNEMKTRNGLESVVSEVLSLKTGQQVVESNLSAVNREMDNLKQGLNEYGIRLTSLLHDRNLTDTNLQMLTSEVHNRWGKSRQTEDCMFEARLRSDTVPEGHIMIFKNDVYNPGSYFNRTSGMFTAPVKGIYMFWVSAQVKRTQMTVRIQSLRKQLGIGIGTGLVSFTTIGTLRAGEQVWFNSTTKASLEAGSSYGGALLRPTHN